MTVIESDKALRYIGLLDHARLNGRWNDIQELARKVDKHAPHRRCLTLTAISEAAIAAAASQRPSTSSSTASYAGLLDVTPKLVQAVDQEKTYFEDAFQANVCLHEIYFMRGEWRTIVGDLDGDVWQQVAQHTKNPLDISPNTRVAILKNRYFLGIAQEQLDNFSAAAKSYQSALKAIENAPKDVAAASEYRAWAERVLGRVCLLHTEQGDPSTVGQASGALSAFRGWSRFWDQAPSRTLASSGTQAQFDVSRIQVWGRYYNVLSCILASGLVYSLSSPALLITPSEVTGPEEYIKARLQQRSEIRRVEAVYENLLLQETHFPKASQSNEEVEKWVQRAMNNWQIFCGPQWSDICLGEGGKHAVSRSMLDILYRAATKTFHSTPILRNLFNVHASLAEFDLAVRAFDTYSEIIARGKSRAEETGEHEVGLDPDDLVVLTAAQAIALLCKYGERPEAEKALSVSTTLSTWLRQQRPTSSAGASTDVRSPTTLEQTPTESMLSRPVLAAAYRAIGQAQANWARLTYETHQRKELQAKALANLQRAADAASPSGSDPETAVLLATVLAESRDFLAAIRVLKTGLALASQNQDCDDESVAADPESLTREQRIAPLWHLLSLLLTARGEYENAVKVSEAAFEQLNGQDLFDESTPPSSVEKPRPVTANSQRIIDQMEDSVKNSLIQIRVTQLALLEVLDSPAAAVDASSSLLALYHKLFGTVNAANTPSQKPVAAAVAAPSAPPRAGGPLKSISGSILGRSRTSRKSLEKPTFEKPANPAIAEADSSFGAPVSIQITNEDGNLAANHEKHRVHIPHHPFKLRGHQGDWRDAGNFRQSEEVNGQDGPTAPTDYNSSPEQPLRQIPHNINNEKEPPPIGHSGQPPEQDVRLPTGNPSASISLPPHFPSAQQRRHNISLLVDIWLFIAGQYIRSDLFEDAGGAIDEAYKLVEAFHEDVARDECSAKAFDDRGWSGGKSVNRLWADVYAERAALAVARTQPHEALNSYEQALSHFPDHPAAVVGISTILLDIFEENIPSEANPLNHPANPSTTSSVPTSSAPSPAQLNRLAARDRAYMLLNTLSRLGEGWDDSEVWMALARAHELSGQVDRAKECLWWVVELEDGRPVRPWAVVDM